MKLKEYLPELPDFVRTQHQMSELSNILNLSKSLNGETARLPSLGSSQTFINSWLRQQMAYRQQMVNDLMMLALTVEEIRSPLNHLSGEVFRRGIHWAPKFVQRCAECNIEFNEFVDQCPKCQTGDLEDPDPTQKERFDAFMVDSNIWSQSLEEVLRFFYFDLNAIDDAYLYIAKEYFAPQDGDPIRSRVIEVRRLHPAAVELALNEEGLPKAQTWVCYMHRPTAQMSGAMGTYGSTPTQTESMITENEPGNCDECGRELVPAMYKYLHQGATQYLLDDEVIHVKKFHHDETYGWSPILTIFEKVLSIKGMDQFVYRYFFERKMPSSMVMVFTDDPESLRRERENIAAKMRMDPHYVPMIAVSSRQSRGRVDMVRMFHTLQEMDYLPVRQEIRERIASMWGVTPAWQGAPEAVGGLSTQTQQLVVMSRVVEADQKLFHEKVFPKLLEAFGVTDWVLQLLQPEEKAEATRLSFAQQRISAANMLFQMGFDVSIKSENVGVDEVRFVVSGEAQQQDPYGGMGMMGGFGGGMGGEEAGPSMNGNGGGGESPFQLMMEKAGNDTWVGQIEKAGHMGAVLHGMSESGDALFFTSKGIDHIAKFNNGTLVEIEKIMRDRMHRHENYPPHDINMPHDTLARKRKAESLLEADEPEDLGI